MQLRYADFSSRAAEILAISSSTVEEHRRLADKIDAEFPILSDPDGKAILAYGLFHPHALPGSERVVARPGIFLIGDEGKIAASMFPENWRIRERPERILAELDRPDTDR